MNEMEKKILAAIEIETEEKMREYGRELGLFGLIGESFKGAFRWAVVAVLLLQLVFIGATVYCAFQLFGSEDPAEKLNWLALGLAAFVTFGLLRLWYFMELNRLSLAREIKRVELQMAVLANALRSLGGGSSAG